MRVAVTVALLLLAAAPALADGHRVAPVSDPLVRKECGGCHMAFPPAFLPAESWNRIMDGLADHFGEDASLPSDQADAIRSFLVANAGGWRRHSRDAADVQVPLRITELRWFRHEHRFPERVWRDPRVMVSSNCPACHRGAEQGWYDDD